MSDEFERSGFTGEQLAAMETSRETVQVYSDIVESEVRLRIDENALDEEQAYQEARDEVEVESIKKYLNYGEKYMEVTLWPFFEDIGPSDREKKACFPVAYQALTVYLRGRIRPVTAGEQYFDNYNLYKVASDDSRLDNGAVILAEGYALEEVIDDSNVKQHRQTINELREKARQAEDDGEIDSAAFLRHRARDLEARRELEKFSAMSLGNFRVLDTAGADQVTDLLRDLVVFGES